MKVHVLCEPPEGEDGDNVQVGDLGALRPIDNSPTLLACVRLTLRALLSPAMPSLCCVTQNFLMLHCAGFHGVAYRRIATELSDRLGGRCRVLAPDFRGHGDTPRGPKAR